jgi:tetratricopeptide (TPR) repeat protein
MSTANPPAASPRLPENRLATWLALALAVAVLCAYAFVVRCDFVEFDDNSHVYQNPLVVHGLTWTGVRDAFAHSQASLWIPLTWISFMADVSVFGLNPGAMHGVNLVLHVAATLALFFLLRRATGRIWPSAFVAAVFGLHPVNVESVAWITERKNVLSILFCFLSLYAYVRYVEKPRPLFYVAAWLGAAFSLLAKPMAVTLPFALLLFDHWPLARWGRVPWRRLLLEKIPFLLLSMGVCWAALQAPSERESIVNTETLTIAARLSNAVTSYVAYLGLIFFPGDLAVFYPHPIDAQPVLAAFAIVLLLGISTLALLWLKTRPYVFVGWCWFLGVLVPVLGLVQIGSQARADRFIYLPQIGILCAFTWLVIDLWPKAQRRVLALSAATVLAACALLTARQTGWWVDTVTLFERTVAVTSRNACAHTNAGMAHAKIGDYARAIPHYQASLRICPDQSAIWIQLGAALNRIGEQAPANECFRNALRIDPKDTTARYNLATGLIKTGAAEEAIPHFETLIQAEPDIARARYHYARALQTKGRSGEALEQLRVAAQLAPSDDEIQTALRTLSTPKVGVR